MHTRIINPIINTLSIIQACCIHPIASVYHSIGKGGQGGGFLSLFGDGIEVVSEKGVGLQLGGYVD